MKRFLLMVLICAMLFSACAYEETEPTEEEYIEITEDVIPDNQPNSTEKPPIDVPKIEGLTNAFMMGADVSSLVALEKSGRVFYDEDGMEQNAIEILSQSGLNYIRVRVWNNPFDENGKGYGGGNCTISTAIELGKKAAQCGMGLFVDFHYSDFWADPGKQQAPKAWQGKSLEEKETAIYNYTLWSLSKIKQNGIKVGMVQVGNETTNGFCGETGKEEIYRLMCSAAKAIRDSDKDILIAVHYTNPENGNYADYANDLKNYGMDYDVFATSYYPEYHGTVANLKEQLTAVHNISGKKVLIAETAWAYDSNEEGAYAHSVQGQADLITDCVRLMVEMGDAGLGVFYWEPAWIDVPGDNWEDMHMLREYYGAGWASSYAGSYDPEDAGKYYGGTACIPTALFDPEGYPLDSIKTFYYLRYGA